MIGSLGIFIEDNHNQSTLTTPESIELQEIFKSMGDSKVVTCIMEVSSHSIELLRVKDCDFDIGIFTNLTHEHLDFHKNIENYYKVKRKLFFQTRSFNIINIDDTFGKRLVEDVANLEPRLITYGIQNKADIYGTEILLSECYSKFKLNTPLGKVDVTVNLPGTFNIYNSLSAAACAYAQGVPLEDIKKGIESINSVPGRFEIIPTNMDFSIIIDYAHTPDGFQNILKTISQFSGGRIVMVFGCVGERDQSKRSKMGRIAAQYSTLSVLTTDNCRSEDPKKIVNKIKEGFDKVNGKYIEILDRKEAIRYAILNSKENDIVLITGKGHEQQQIIGNKVMYFNEKEIIADALKELAEKNSF